MHKENNPLISIIIPTLNEEENMAACLASTQNAPDVERIVVDGGSKDRTLEIARSCGAKVLRGPVGRARQMNAGAESAKGEFLLFLHADTRLPEGFSEIIRHMMTLPRIVAGAFEFRLDVSSPGLRLIERVANWRSRILQLPYGDQAIFTRLALFREMGGYRDMPIMEDYELVQRLKKRGRIVTVPYPAMTSARRWGKLGTFKATFLNYGIVIAYHAGISPARILRFARRG
jgi:rSAM/selenodomain-associated transferase 2